MQLHSSTAQARLKSKDTIAHSCMQSPESTREHPNSNSNSSNSTAAKAAPVPLSPQGLKGCRGNTGRQTHTWWQQQQQQGEQQAQHSEQQQAAGEQQTPAAVVPPLHAAAGVVSLLACPNQHCIPIGMQASHCIPLPATPPLLAPVINTARPHYMPLQHCKPPLHGPVLWPHQHCTSPLHAPSGLHVPTTCPISTARPHSQALGTLPMESMALTD